MKSDQLPYAKTACTPRCARHDWARIDGVLRSCTRFAARNDDSFDAPEPRRNRIEDANGAATEQVRNSLDADKETGSFKHIVPFCSRRTNRAQARVVSAFVIGSLLAHPASLNRSASGSKRARKIRRQANLQSNSARTPHSRLRRTCRTTRHWQVGNPGSHCRRSAADAAALLDTGTLRRSCAAMRFVCLHDVIRQVGRHQCDSLETAVPIF